MKYIFTTKYSLICSHSGKLLPYMILVHHVVDSMPSGDRNLPKFYHWDPSQGLINPVCKTKTIVPDKSPVILTSWYLWSQSSPSHLGRPWPWFPC